MGMIGHWKGIVLVTAEATWEGPSFSLGGGSLYGGVKRGWARKDKEMDSEHQAPSSKPAAGVNFLHPPHELPRHVSATPVEKKDSVTSVPEFDTSSR